MVQHHGKELSYNNLADMDAAWRIVSAFERPAAAVIKHQNPCGVASADSISEAYQNAYDADPVSAFGSIVSVNRPVDTATAEAISKTFVEVVVAPSFDAEALAILTKKPSIRLVSLEGATADATVPALVYRQVAGGFLVQDADVKRIQESDLDVVTKVHPTKAQLNELLFAFNVVRNVKSNAIVISKSGQTRGIGAGQMNRVESVAIAIATAKEAAQGGVMASDAFFPFGDSVELAAKAGIVAIIQPGGSKRDQESIDACDQHGIAMVFTHSRHFLH